MSSFSPIWLPPYGLVPNRCVGKLVTSTLLERMIILSSKIVKYRQQYRATQSWKNDWELLAMIVLFVAIPDYLVGIFHQHKNTTPQGCHIFMSHRGSNRKRLVLMILCQLLSPILPLSIWIQTELMTKTALLHS
jgi:hypothetical protein